MSTISLDPPPTSTPTGSSAGVILVVDDTEDHRYVAAKWLERAGFRVVLACNGAEALERARGEVELVVLDVHLPDLDGFEVTRKLKSDPATAHIPVLHLSAHYVAPTDRVHGLDGGADGYLTQPIIPEELVATVGALLRLSRAERALRERNHELESAHADALRARAGSERVLALSVALSSATTAREVSSAVLTHVPPLFGASGAVLVAAHADSAELEILAAADMPPELESAWRRFPREAPVPLAESVRTGEPVFLESRDDWEARYPGSTPMLEASGHHANAVSPLIVDGLVVGSLGIAFTAPHAFPAEERAMLRSTAQHCALAMERTRLLELERNSRLAAEAASRAKSDFLAVMSHELRTPLNAIGGYAELIELGLRGPVTAEQVRDLHRIQSSQRHLMALINQVLNYTRVDAGHVEYDLSDVRVIDALNQAEALVSPQVHARGLECEIVPPDPALVVRADREKLQQVLLNLITNSIKFTDEGRIRLGADARDATVAVWVEDTGVGIAADKLASVFDPFVQVQEAVYTRTNDGVGLGLAISRELARGMGGELTVQSVPGRGSRFTIALPRAV